MSKTATEKAIELKNWETNISNMENVLPNPNYKFTKPNNKYYRFTDYMKGWVMGLFGYRLTHHIMAQHLLPIGKQNQKH